MKSLLIIDFANTVLRSLSINSNLIWNNQVTGGLYGFISQLTSKINKIAPTHILICKDAPPYLRTTLYPNYKSDRKKAKKPDWYSEIENTYHIVDQFIELCNLQVWKLPGFEADDLIAATIKQHHKQFKSIDVLSNDDDLYQLLDYQNVTLLKKTGNINYKKFKELYPTLEPEDWKIITAMTGTHNAIKGIDRCGLKTALKWFDYQTKTGEPHPNIIKNKHCIDLNLKLIELPLILKDHPIKDIQLRLPFIYPQCREIMRYLYQFGIAYTKSMDNAFSLYNDASHGFEL